MQPGIYELWTANRCRCRCRCRALYNMSKQTQIQINNILKKKFFAANAYVCLKSMRVSLLLLIFVQFCMVNSILDCCCSLFSRCIFHAVCFSLIVFSLLLWIGATLASSFYIERSININTYMFGGFGLIQLYTKYRRLRACMCSSKRE